MAPSINSKELADIHKVVYYLEDENTKLHSSVDILSSQITALTNRLNILEKRFKKHIGKFDSHKEPIDLKEMAE